MKSLGTPTDWSYPGSENFRFVTTGIQDAVAAAQRIAGDKNVGVAAGVVATRRPSKAGEMTGTLANMKNRAGRIALIVVGVIALFTGLVWVGQGLNLIPGSVMSGDRTWFNIGVIVGLIGLVLLVLGLRRPRT